MKKQTKNIIMRYRKDMRYRAEMTLRISFFINLVYAAFEAVCGFVLHSAWNGAVAFYYIVLSSMRFYILHKDKHKDIANRWKTYRACGAIMLPLTFAIAGIHILTMRKYYEIEYPGYMIYAVAAYTFYSAVNAIRNVIIYWKMNDPILLASKKINLAVAAISMYNLQAAMITAFENSQEETFRITMGSCVGAGVFVIIVGISIFMIVNANKKLSKLPQKYRPSES